MNNEFDNFTASVKSWSTTQLNPIKSENDVFDLAEAFLLISSMTHKKLQKLCYYAKAWYLAINDIDLIPNNHFEAWVHGAVQPDLYQAYKMYGFSLIPMTSDERARSLPEEFISFAQEIYESYGELSGDELEKLNHTEEPWKKAREGLKPWQGSHRVIMEDDMKTFYRSVMESNA